MNGEMSPTERFNALVDEVLTRGEGSPIILIAKLTRSACLTKGKGYHIKFQSSPNSLWFEDDYKIPVQLSPQSYNDWFEQLTTGGKRTVDQTSELSRKKHTDTVRKMVNELNALHEQTPTLAVNDVVVFNDEEEENGGPMVVAKLLNRDEQLRAASIAGSLATHDVLVYHARGYLGTSVFNSRVLKKIGSLSEWGIPAVDPTIISAMSVFTDPVEPQGA